MKTLAFQTPKTGVNNIVQKWLKTYQIAQVHRFGLDSTDEPFYTNFRISLFFMLNCLRQPMT